MQYKLFFKFYPSTELGSKMQNHTPDLRNQQLELHDVTSISEYKSIGIYCFRLNCHKEFKNKCACIIKGN